MRICWKFDDGRNGFCLTIPGGWPLLGGIPRARTGGKEVDGSGVYSDLLSDGALLHAIHEAAGNVTDKAAREALSHGVKAAVDALQRRVGAAGLSISLDD